MEKINTPLGEVYKKLKSAKKLADKRKDSEHWRARSIQIDSTIKLVESLFTKERDMIEEKYIQGCHDSQNFNMDLSDDDSLKEYASDCFTQTFKSYE